MSRMSEFVTALQIVRPNVEFNPLKRNAGFGMSGRRDVGTSGRRETRTWAPPGLQELMCVTILEAGLQSHIQPVAYFVVFIVFAVK